MTHRVVISRAISDLLSDPLVQAEMSTNQKARMERLVPENAEIDPDCFPNVTHCLERIYSKDD